ncbi:ubiquinone/menaquinone biosynthesis methyltransferase [Engelhardtia mirabilis]|uniref:Demethylmenaquinone methyltransferase n=1 Tax=Engelhardtia mirabilis TaxID=2528011 RepID=A0A518BJA6_9BACT|nr:UbiE/COQ5 methyltransferase [Planctomycetes bacterium Pla133]QDV01375.1 UbiE/COQ5 methyltransferase [Planctomycetes bacterium Pla86]
MPDPSQVRPMFGRIARHYDLLNWLLTAGIDRRWRAAAVEAAGPLEGAVAVDACCGTGDLTLALAGAGARTIGVDFTPQMLTRARTKCSERRFMQGDALKLPVADGRADVSTVAFGIRNVADRLEGLREMTRVVRPGGRVVVLELSTPPGAVLGGLYRLYFTRILPLIGKLISGDGGAYRYLPETVLAWPKPEEFAREMAQAGLVDVEYRLLTRGICALHVGRRPQMAEVVQA